MLLLFSYFMVFLFFPAGTRELLGEMDGIDVLLQQLSVRSLVEHFNMLLLHILRQLEENIII